MNDIQLFLEEQSSKISSPEIPLKLADALASALHLSFPFTDRSGAMRRGVTAHQSLPRKSSEGWSIGVGSLTVLGTPEEHPPPHTIGDFLRDYRKLLQQQYEAHPLRASEARGRAIREGAYLRKEITRTKRRIREIRKSELAKLGFRNARLAEQAESVLSTRINRVQTERERIHKKYLSGTASVYDIVHARDLRKEHRSLLSQRRKIGVALEPFETLRLHGLLRTLEEQRRVVRARTRK